ncbi:MAG: type II 3-dehydroquinate dehydratase [Ignavibacteriota bacterium]
MKILILHGPNLNLLGEREPDIYGTQTLGDINAKLQELAHGLQIELRIIQSNHEGILVDSIQEHTKWADVLLINPGAFTHYSYALRDSIAAFAKPTVEVHLTDLNSREEFRKHSVLEGLSNVTRIMGKGAVGYYEALENLASRK